MFKVALIDSDSIACACAAVLEKKDKITGDVELEPIHHGYYLVNTKIKKCMESSGTSNCEVYITSGGKQNFRFSIFRYYKESRYKCVEKCGDPHPYDCSEKKGHKLLITLPLSYSALKEYLVMRWGALESIKEEADDAVSIRNYELNEGVFYEDKKECIMWHIDKDLNNNPGWHGNYNTQEVYYITPIQALRNFYLQILTGDTSDNIPRVKFRWRQKDAEALINKAETEEELLEIVRKTIYNIRKEEFKDDFTDIELMQLMEDELCLKGRLCWMRRKKGELWSPITMSWAMREALKS